jgi:hypothetical protein
MNSFAGDAEFGSNIALEVCNCVLRFDGDGSEFEVIEFGFALGKMMTGVLYFVTGLNAG